jgi:hypothetical protein
MKKLISLICAAVFAVCGMTSCAQTSKTEKSANMDNKKILIVYFSRTGENYGVGNISKGNTHIIADILAAETGGETFEIKPVNAYPHEYQACVNIARNEKDTNARPTIQDDIRIEDYDVIFLGYPNWWGDMPMPVYTFLEKHNWSGKTIIPFCTHEGSGLSNTENYIRNTCKGADVKSGLAVRGNTAQNSRTEAQKTVHSWLNKLAL